MGKWLTKAKAAFGTSRTAEVPEIVELTCECGAPVKSVRKRESQRAMCSTCGKKLYVFPRTCYPVPQSIAAARRTAGQPEPALAGTASASGSAPAPTKQPAHVEQPLPASRRRGTAGALPPRVGGPPERKPQPQAPPPPEPQGIALQQKPSTRYRLPLVVGLVVIVLLSTLYFVWRTTARSAAERRFQVALSQGEEYLSENQIAQAQTEFAAAAAAAEFLGRDDREARRAMQRYRETTAMNKLLVASFGDMIQSATKYLGAGKVSEWDRHFRDRYGSDWLVFDTLLVRTSAEKSEFEWQHPLYVGSVPIRMVGELDKLEQIVGPLAADEPQRVIIAVQPAQLRLVPSIEPYWELRFNPDTAFLWEGADTLAARWGEELVDDVRKVLAQQRTALKLDGPSGSAEPSSTDLPREDL